MGSQITTLRNEKQTLEKKLEALHLDQDWGLRKICGAGG